MAFAGRAPERVALPTYPFERRRFWLQPESARRASGHPLLGPAVALAREDGWLLDGEVSLTAHPWLADHAVSGVVLLPATAFLDLALEAASHAGCDTVEELILETPLALGAARTQVQVSVGAPGADGRRPLEIHAREGGEWARLAVGTVVRAPAPAQPPPVLDWPPAGAEPLDATALEDRLAGLGFGYGPAFQLLRSAWRQGEELFAEAVLDDPQAARFGLHPALLDAVLHPAFDLDGVRLPFSWTGVRLLRRGAGALRAHISPLPDGSLRVLATDTAGVPVLTVDRLASRPPTAAGDDLYRLAWEELPTADGASIASAEPADVSEALALVQRALVEDRRLAIVTRGAVATESPDPDVAAIWGLVRSAQSEHPGRFVLVDAESDDDLTVPAGEPQVALRGGRALVPRLRRAAVDELPGGAWRLEVERVGTVDGVKPVAGDADRPLRDGEVRVAMRAAGVNFQDVVSALGMVPGQERIGVEGAGVVTELGDGVSDLAVGDRVLGFIPGAFGPLAIADARTLVRIPEGWSFADAAAVPAAFATATHALVDLARVRPGERVLIHAAAGGVGLAAVQVAQLLGAEVFATASESKWPVLRALGISDDHLASSRSADFRERFQRVDVVLNALAGDLIDASLALLPRGGRFIEMGKTDIREPAGVEYTRFDLLTLPPERLGGLLRDAVATLERGELAPLPVTAFDVRRGAEALRFVSQARHVGKVVLTVPRPLDPDGTVLRDRRDGRARGAGRPTSGGLARRPSPAARQPPRA